MNAAPLRLAAVVAAGLSASAALANPLEKELPAGKDTCWDRQYDAAHLAAHPKQRVTAIRVVRQGTAATDGTFVILMFNLRQRIKTEAPQEPGYDYKVTAFCKAARGGLACENEFGQGKFRIERGAKGGLLVRTPGLTLNPGNYDAEDLADDAVKLPAKPDDGAWAVTATSTASCPY